MTLFALPPCLSFFLFSFHYPLSSPSPFNPLSSLTSIFLSCLSFSNHLSPKTYLSSLSSGLVRAGSSDWLCSSYISLCAERILSKIVVPNLIWRVRLSLLFSFSFYLSIYKSQIHLPTPTFSSPISFSSRQLYLSISLYSTLFNPILLHFV